MSPSALRSPPLTMDEFRSLVSTAFELDSSASLAQSLRGVSLEDDTAKEYSPKTPSSPSSTSSTSPFRKLRAYIRSSAPPTPTKVTSPQRSIQTISIVPSCTTADTDPDASYIPYLPLASQHEYTCRRQTSNIFSSDTSSRDSYYSSTHSSESSTSSSSGSSSSSSAYLSTQHHSSSSSSSHIAAVLSDSDSDPFAKGHVQVVRRSQQGLGYPTPPGSPSSLSPSSSRRSSRTKRPGSAKRNRLTKKSDVYSLIPPTLPAPSRPLPSLPMAPHPFSFAAISSSCKALPAIPPTHASRAHPIPRPRPTSRDWTLSLPVTSNHPRSPNAMPPRYAPLQAHRVPSTMKRNSHLKARPTHKRRGSPFPLSLRLHEPSLLASPTPRPRRLSTSQSPAQSQLKSQSQDVRMSEHRLTLADSGLPVPRLPHGKDGREARRERRSGEVQSGWYGGVDVEDEEEDGRSYYTARSSFESGVSVTVEDV